jgi:hypothetical protein
MENHGKARQGMLFQGKEWHVEVKKCMEGHEMELHVKSRKFNH